MWYFHTLEFYSAIKRELSTDMDEYQKTLCLDKETRHKIQHTIWLHLNEILDKATNLWWQKTDPWLLEVKREGLTFKRHEGNIQSDENILYLNWLHRYKHVKTHQTVHSKWEHFSLFKLHFNKLIKILKRDSFRAKDQC